MQRIALFGIGLLSLFSLSIYSFTEGDRVYFEKVPKNGSSAFLNRLADMDYHYVLSPLKNRDALSSVEIPLKKNQPIYLGELKNERPVPDGAVCFGKICAIHLPFQAHKHNADFGYLELISDHMVFPPMNFSEEPPLAAGPLPQLEHWSAALLKKKLSELSGAKEVSIGQKRTRISERGSKQGRQDALHYLRAEYENLGYTVRFEEFSSRRGRSGANIIAERLGQDPSKIFVVSSHIDSAGNAGADDDGSGTIAALAIAAAIKDLPLKYTVRFIGFDLEEVGIVGAAAHARNLVDAGEMQNIVGDFHLEMTGYDGDGDGAYHIVYCRENRSGHIKDIILDTATQADLDVRYVKACTSRSDHSVFWRHNRPAIVISQNFFGGDSNPCYHRRCDTVDNLDFDYMEKLTQLSALSVARIIKGPAPFSYKHASKTKARP